MNVGSKDFTPTTDLLAGSPKMMYTYFLLSECAKYLDAMKQPRDINVDTTTNSLLAFCPNTKLRDKFWQDYIDRKKAQDSAVTASILTIGDFQAYLSEILEFTEKAHGAF